MTSIEFYLLTAVLKADYIYKHGIFIGKLKHSGGCKLMYQVDAFYVEISYSQYRHSIKNIAIFDSTEVLDPYLEQVPVADLIDCFS